MRETVGIVGMGFVGSAVASGLRTRSNVTNSEVTVITYDKFQPNKSNIDLAGIAEEADVCFVCVPTPMLPDGSCDISIVRSVVSELSSLARVTNRRLNLEIVIKSTIPPGTCAMLQAECPNVVVIFNPEFLTEANADRDFLEQDRIILGGNIDEKSTIYTLYDRLFHLPDTYIVSWEVAEMVKYTANCFLATKVSFANEIKQVCDALSIDYEEVIDYATLDTRLGESHWRVPGPMKVGNDHVYGFGGGCFPKDLNGLIAVAQAAGVKPTVMTAAWQKNLEVRAEKHRDWEWQARAVTKIRN